MFLPNRVLVRLWPFRLFALTHVIVASPVVARLNLKIMEVPIRYRERSYGRTNISRWRHGWLLLRMVLFAVRRIKFV